MGKRLVLAAAFIGSCLGVMFSGGSMYAWSIFIIVLVMLPFFPAQSGDPELAVVQSRQPLRWYQSPLPYIAILLLCASVVVYFS